MELMEELTPVQLEFLSDMHRERGAEDSFTDLIEGFAHQAAEKGMTFSSFVDVYLCRPAEHRHMSAQNTVDSTIERHPLAIVLGDRRPTVGWLALRCVACTLERVRRMASRQLFQRCRLPELFSITGGPPNQMITLRRPKTHDPACPSSSRRQRAGRRIHCVCIGLLCEALEQRHSDATTPAQEAARPAEGSATYQATDTAAEAEAAENSSANEDRAPRPPGEWEEEPDYLQATFEHWGWSLATPGGAADIWGRGDAGFPDFAMDDGFD